MSYQMFSTIDIKISLDHGSYLLIHFFDPPTVASKRKVVDIITYHGVLGQD